MPNYSTPTGDSAEPFVQEFKRQRRQLREQARPDGTNIARLLQKVREALVNINATVKAATDSYLSTGTVNMANLVINALTASGSVSAAGPIFTPHGRATPVTTGYVSAWLNSDGRVGATASSIQFKQDIEPADTAAEVDALLRLALIRFRYIEDVEKHGDAAPWHLGSIAEYMQLTALSEWVPLDQDGNAFSINWEHVTIPMVAALQSANARANASDARQAELEGRVTALEALIADGNAADS